MPLQATSGAASQDAFGGNGVAVVPTYIEDVFSTYLYTGNGSTQTITNGIDLSTKGGLVWIKHRSGTGDHGLTDTARGATKSLFSDQTYAELTGANDLKTFNNNGFSIGDGTQFSINNNNSTYASWTFRKQPKMFDIQTWTGTGGSRTITTALNGTTGCIILKRTDTSDQWWVVHRSGANGFDSYGILNQTAAFTSTGSGISSVTDTSFTISSYYNGSGSTWVAYIFAHNAGGFGLSGSENVISCGSFTTDGSGNATVNLGYEPQWVIQKATDAVYGWWMNDNMRGMPAVGGSNTAQLNAEAATAETSTGSLGIRPNATGFTVANGVNTKTFIYIAIRRGPMKVPTTGTSVFSPFIGTSSAAPAYISNFVVDMGMDRAFGGTDNMDVASRLTGANKLVTSSTAAETADGDLKFDYMTGYYLASRSSSFLSYMFQRAPSFFDEVCYTGNNVSGRTITHNLAAVPELMIVKSRTSGTRDWIVYDATNGATKYMNLNNNSASSSGSFWVSTAPTSTVFTVSDSSSVNDPAQNYVAYLFSTCPGVSKVGSYTGTATTKQIDCGFTGGARFVLIKRTDSTGDWYVWDTARGIISGNDPYLLLNSTAAEVTSTDYIDTYSAGFEISSTAPAAINASGGNFVFLAIA